MLKDGKKQAPWAFELRATEGPATVPPNHHHRMLEVQRAATPLSDCKVKREELARGELIATVLLDVIAGVSATCDLLPQSTKLVASLSFANAKGLHTDNVLALLRPVAAPMRSAAISVSPTVPLEPTTPHATAKSTIGPGTTQGTRVTPNLPATSRKGSNLITKYSLATKQPPGPHATTPGRKLPLGHLTGNSSAMAAMAPVRKACEG
eukprot:CAMPEP_0176173664 /NCGR_PEP_ID=MMETSP0120_2-20121206/88975_1 /TAXON_ID=160619 /ORGANISM="Kryptoperidinium foliaceum, Strain CCMP 1326" /LENGTH=207 /DNA_ID=CAMNT_0017511683 /DNA_START=60 /DNA_END=684 /DNA_ORIENTATION=+